MSQHFASDNYAGICPEAWAAMADANAGSAPGYGDDLHTRRAEAAIADLFGTACSVFFVFNGTAANALALAALCRPYHAVLCTNCAHLDVDEAGAPAFFSGGTSLITAPATKLTPAHLDVAAAGRRDVHAAKLRAVSISQTTETGQVYTPGEVAALGAACRARGLPLHMDGARFANACAALEADPADLTCKAGVDVLCFGGTKNGMAMGEAIVFFDPVLAEEFAWRRKQAGQLASKMRFVAAPWAAMLPSGGWLANARHANACARRFADGIDPARILYPVEANAVFLDLAEAEAEALRARGWLFHTFAGNASRFMFGWDAEPARIDALRADLACVLRP